MLSLAFKVCEREDEIGISQFFEGSSCDPVCSKIAVGGLLRSTKQTFAGLIRDSRAVGKLARFSNFPRLIRPCLVSVYLIAMFSSLTRHCRLALFDFLSTSCFQCIRHAPEFSVPMLLCTWPLMRWALTRVTKSSSTIGVKPLATTGTSQMWLFILSLTFVLVLAETSTPFAGYAVQLVWPYLRTITASLAWCCRT